MGMEAIMCSMDRNKWGWGVVIKEFFWGGWGLGFIVRV
jgi:hypothetical protein